MVLLGEPGIGKSTAIGAEWDTARARLAARGGTPLPMDLKEYGSEDRLVWDLFECEPFKVWLTGNHTLHLFLDSLDECQLGIRNIASVLGGEFKKRSLHAGRLRLRIACRTADWPSTLENAMRELWGKEGVGVYELVPLRRRDVVAAAEAEGLAAGAFLDQVSDREVVPLAIRPVTLSFLIRAFAESDDLPRTRRELYERGCRLLCEEVSQSRHAAGYTGNLSGPQRLDLASLIAAVSMFCAKSNLFVGERAGPTSNEELVVDELAGTKDARTGKTVAKADLEEVVGTALFAGRGPGRLGFAHRTYAEFLAARYVDRQNLDISQKLSLVRHPADTTGKIVPQLAEVAAWMAGVDRGLFREIMRSDPQTVLRSDVAGAEEQDRAAAVDSLLRGFDSGELDDRESELWGSYRKLKHGALAKQLEPYLRDRTRGVLVRRFSIEVAQACNETGLVEVLGSIALDPTENPQIRLPAARAVAEIGDDEARLRLKPLLTESAGPDPDDDLRGCALRALWPRLITVEALFASLSPPKRDSYFGSYWKFLVDLETQINLNHLPVALRWCASLPSRASAAHALCRLSDAILQVAWKHLDRPDVLAPLSEYVISRVTHFERILPDGVSWDSIDVESRRRVVEAVVAAGIPEGEHHSLELVAGSARLLSRDDLGWLIGQVRSSQSEVVGKRFAVLARWVYQFLGSDQLDDILLACEASSVLAAEFEPFISPVAFPSPEAERLRRDYEGHARSISEMEARRAKVLLHPPPKERVLRCLEHCEEGHLDWWWRLNDQMRLEPDGASSRDNDLQPDLTKLPGWIEADSATTARIVNAARRYLLDHHTQPGTWLGTCTFDCRDFAGYRALVLVYAEDTGFLENLSAERWANWAPVILAFPITSDNSRKIQIELIGRAYRLAPESVVESMIVLAEKESRSFNRVFTVSALEKCWDRRLCDALLQKAREGGLTPACVGDLLGELISRKHEPARLYALSLVSPATVKEGPSRAMAQEAATALWARVDDAGWPALWPIFQEYPSFGKEVIAAIAHEERHSPRSLERLSDAQLAELYVWLSEQSPKPVATDSDGFPAVTPAESVAEYRENALGILANRGTLSACRELDGIANVLPQASHLRWVSRAARQTMLRQTWLPLSPQDFVALTQERGHRLVQSADQLLDVLIESLERLQTTLHGETPAVRDLWDRQAGSPVTWRPVDEPALSHYVKRHLEADLNRRGIIALREVEIRRGFGGEPGQKTDIHVTGVLDVPSLSSRETVRVIIETKGCWHDELLTAMKTQLVDRYLKDNQCDHGLYLVGWFNSSLWDTEDRRRNSAPDWTIEEARAEFNRQAEDVSTDRTTVRAYVLDAGLR